jgi:hypothetical protein
MKIGDIIIFVRYDYEVCIDVDKISYLEGNRVEVNDTSTYYAKEHIGQESYDNCPVWVEGLEIWSII